MTRSFLFTVGFLALLVAAFFLLVKQPEQRSLYPQQEVTTRIPRLLSEGPYIHVQRNRAEAWLVDNEGWVKHKWYFRKNVGEEKRNSLKGSTLHHVEPAKDGTMFGILKDLALIQVNSDSEVLNYIEGTFHHDLEFTSSGGFVTLERELTEVAVGDEKGIILDDKISFFDDQGERTSQHSLFSIMKSHIPLERIEQAFSFSATASKDQLKSDSPADILHTNSLEVIQKPISGLAPSGSLLLSFRHINMIAIVDPTLTKVLWTYGPEGISWQHAPTMTRQGTILLFDNGRAQKTSRVIEIEPTTKNIVWEFNASDYDEKKFYSPARGNAEQLSNGNILFSLGNTGVAVEVTPTKKIAWKYKPIIESKHGDRVHRRKMTIYRIIKIEDKNLLGRLLSS